MMVIFMRTECSFHDHLEYGIRLSARQARISEAYCLTKRCILMARDNRLNSYVHVFSSWKFKSLNPISNALYIATVPM